MIQTTKFDVSTSFYPLCIVQGFCFVLFFKGTLCMNCSQHLGEFVTVRPTLPSCCKAELVELNQKLLGMTTCFLGGSRLSKVIHLSSSTYPFQCSGAGT